MLGFWKTSKSGQRGVVSGRWSSANSAPGRVADVSVEGAFGHARETVKQQRTTADVTAVMRTGSLRAARSTSVRLSPTIDEVCSKKNDTPAAAGELCQDRSVQTSDELLQQLICDGLRQRRRPAAAAAADASPPVYQADSVDDLVNGACRPWRRHSLSSMGPLSPRLASPVDDIYQMPGRPPVLSPGDLNLDDMLGDGDVSPRSLSPLSIAEMSSPPRRWRRFELQAADPYANGRSWGAGRLPAYENPHCTVGLPPLPQSARTTAPPPQRAPLRRQKPYLGAIKGRAAGPGRPRGIVADVERSPASSKSSGAGRDAADDGGDSSEGAGAKSLSTLSLEDAISRSMSRLSDDDDGVGRERRVTAVPLSNVTPCAATRNDVTRNDVTGAGRSSVVTSRRPPHRVVLSSDV